MKDVLAVYAVKITTDPDNPLDAIEMDEERKAVLTDIFWAMNTISHSTETYTEEETVEVEVEGEDGETHTEQQTQTIEKPEHLLAGRFFMPPWIAGTFPWASGRRDYAANAWCCSRGCNP